MSINHRLEQDSNRLKQKEDSHIWGFVIQDAGWGWGPASDGKTLFAGPAGSCDWFGCERPHMPGDGGAVWGERGQRCQVVAALAGERQCCDQADGRLETTAADKRTRVVAGADRREAGSDLARSGAELAERGTPASYGAVWRFFKREGSALKKAYTPVSRTAPISPADAPSGRNSSAGLTPSAWCSSTKPGLRPI